MKDTTTRVRMSESATVGMPGVYCVINKLDQRQVQVTSTTYTRMCRYDAEDLPVHENTQSQGHDVKKDSQEHSVKGMLESGRLHLPIGMIGHQAVSSEMLEYSLCLYFSSNATPCCY